MNLSAQEITLQLLMLPEQEQQEGAVEKQIRSWLVEKQ